MGGGRFLLHCNWFLEKNWFSNILPSHWISLSLFLLCFHQQFKVQSEWSVQSKCYYRVAWTYKSTRKTKNLFSSLYDTVCIIKGAVWTVYAFITGLWVLSSWRRNMKHFWYTYKWYIARLVIAMFGDLDLSFEMTQKGWVLNGVLRKLSHINFKNKPPFTD